jgi:hypothetical protein
VNEGAFGSGNGDISVINPNDNTIINDVFYNVNGYPLGDIAQSVFIRNNKAYIVVNVSQKIEVVSLPGFNRITTISGLGSPRYMISHNNKGYVSDWSGNNIRIIDLSTNNVTGSYTTGNGPEQMEITNNRLFVVNSGGYDIDSTVTVINLLTGQNDTVLNVGINPNSIKTDAEGKIWILCGGTTGPDYIGGTSDDKGGSLWRINPANYSVEAVFAMNQFEHPFKMQLSGDGRRIYFLNGIDGYNGSVFSMNITDTTLPLIPVVSRNFYGLGIHPSTGRIYGGVSPSVTQSGYVLIFSREGIQTDSLLAGIGPGNFGFK